MVIPNHYPAGKPAALTGAGQGRQGLPLAEPRGQSRGTNSSGTFPFRYSVTAGAEEVFPATGRGSTRPRSAGQAPRQTFAAGRQRPVGTDRPPTFSPQPTSAPNSLFLLFNRPHRPQASGDRQGAGRKSFPAAPATSPPPPQIAPRLRPARPFHEGDWDPRPPPQVRGRAASEGPGPGLPAATGAGRRAGRSPCRRR